MEMVNGYVCRSCTDVEYAKKNIDPKHPRKGPGREDVNRPSSGVELDPRSARAANDKHQVRLADAAREQRREARRSDGTVVDFVV